MILNPIIGREVKVRWRTWGSSGLMLLMLSGLAFAMGASYGDLISINNRGSVPATGRNIFVTLSFLQMGAWLLLSPVLTSMNIAAERERGLLESLQLSPLRAHQIAGGKLFSALAFIVLLSLTTLPIVGITFLLGGVSPYEFFGATALNLLAALCGASIGLFCSARSRRPLSALLASLGIVAIWFFGTYFLFAISQGPAWFGSTANFFYQQLCGWSSFSNPMISLQYLLEPRYMLRGAAFAGPAEISCWAIFPCFATALSLLALWGAGRAVRKPFQPAMPNDRHWLSFLGAGRSRQTAVRQAAGAAPIESRLLRELRLDAWANFRNPVLRREVRGAFRFRRAKAWQGIAQLLFATLLLGGYVFLLYAMLGERRGVAYAIDSWSPILNIWFFLVLSTCAIWCARSFARERENGLSEGIWLSLLTPREIVSAKLLAPLISIAVYSLPVFLLLLLSVDFSGTPHAPNNYYYYDRAPGPLEAFAALCIAAVTAYATCTFALYVSYRSSRVTSAVVTVIVILLLLWTIGVLFLQVILHALEIGNSYRTTDQLLHLTHPFVAINDIRARIYDESYQTQKATYLSLWYIPLTALVGGVFHWRLLNRARHGDRQQDSANSWITAPETNSTSPTPSAQP